MSVPARRVDRALNTISQLARNDLRSFCAVFLPHHFEVTEKENDHPEWAVSPGWGEPQRKLADALTRFFDRDPDYRTYHTLIVEIFRGAGKSTIGAMASTLWLACTRRRRNIVLISDTRGQAIDHLASILDELENNDRLQEEFGQLYVEKRTASKTERKRQDDVTLLNGVRIVAKGAGQKLRGMKWKQWRPDAVILDDPQGEKQAESAEQAEKLNRWVDRVVIPMGALNTLFVLIGTPLRHNDIIAHMKAKPASLHLRYPAITAEGEATDPHRFPKARLLHLKGEMGPTAFDQEMGLIPAGEDAKPFRLEWMRTWPEMPRLEDGPAFVGYDPHAKLKEKSDMCGIVVGRSIENHCVIERAVQARLNLDDQVSAVVMLAMKSGARTIVVESIAAQEWAKQQLEKKLKEKNYKAMILSQEHNNDKRIFLENVLQAPLFNGTIRFVQTKETDDLKTQLSQFPLGGHDDLCDALADMFLGYMNYRRATLSHRQKEWLDRYVKANKPVTALQLMTQ
jgi:phage terminase large subunit-like protein